MNQWERGSGEWEERRAGPGRATKGLGRGVKEPMRDQQ